MLPPNIEAKIEKEPMSGCWLWSGCLNRHGYGLVGFNGRTRIAHRVVYELLIGLIPPGLTIDHLCRVRCCVNPKHMEPVSMYENVMRGESFSAREARQTHCKNGHPYSGENLRREKRQRRCRACARAVSRRAWLKERATHPVSKVGRPRILKGLEGEK